MVFLTTVASAVPVGPFPDAEDPLEPCEFTLTRTKASTMAMTTTTLPEAIRIRLRISVRRAAARCAAILCWRELPSRLALLAFPIACRNLASRCDRPAAVIAGRRR